MNVLHKFKKFTALTLACLTALTSIPLTSFAATGVGGNASGSSTGGVVTSSGGDFGVNISPDRTGRIGIRLSLVDRENPEKVISVDNDGNPQVLDIMYVTSGQFAYFISGQYLTKLTEDNTYSAVKTQDYTQKNNIKWLFWDQLQQATDKDGNSILEALGGEIQPWARYDNNAYRSLGEEFVQWCLSDKNGVAVMAEGDTVTITTTVDGKKVTVENSNGQNNIQASDSNQIYTITGDTRRTFSDFSSYYDYAGASLFDEVVNGVSVASERYAYEQNTIALMREDGRITDNEYESLMVKLRQIKQDYDNRNVTASLLGKLKDKFLGSDITAYAAENNNAGTNETTYGGSPRILTLLTLADENGNPYLQTPSMIEAGTKDIAQAKEDWILMVEPIVYLTIFKSGNDKEYVMTKQYGTISNVVEAMHYKLGGSYTSKAKYGWFNWKALNGPLWGALHTKTSKNDKNEEVNGYAFKDDKYILTAPSNIGAYRSIDDLAAANAWKDVNGHKEKEGFGVNLYWSGLFSSDIDTWDSPNYSNGIPGPSPDASSDTEYPPESGYGTESKKFQITKWYVLERADGKQEVYDVYTREDTPHIVNVLNEGDENSTFFWEVEKWGTSLTTDHPEDGDLSSTFEEYWNRNKGTQSDTKPARVTIEPDDPDKSIYVKLVMKVIPKKDIDIVRVYENTDGSTTVENELDVPYTSTVDGNSPKDGYDFEESVTTTDPIKEITTWTEVPTGTNGTTPQIPVKETEKTVYIRYTQTDDPEPNPSKLLLHENEISHQFNLSDANGGSLVDGIRKYSSVSSSARCNVVVGNTGYPDYNDIHCRSRYTYDYSDDWSFTITNDADYASNKTFTWAWVQTDQKDYSGNGLSESGGTGTSTPNGEIILQRTINDTVTLYPGKNGGNESKLQEMGLRAPSYTPAKARKDGATDQPTRKTWYETFTTNWQFHNANTPTAYFSPSCGHGGTDTDSHTNTGNEATLNETYSKANNTEILGLWGRANAGLSSPDETSNLSSAKWVFNNLNFIPRKEHLKTSEIQFYPYYKIKFVSEINGAEQDAYLTSENLSKLLNVQRVDTSISANGNTSTGNSLYLDSTQSL